MRHKTHYIVEYSGNTITAGDWAVWVRGDEKPGVSACTGAADIAVTAANEGTKDAGGLVREEEGVLRSNLLLLSVDDGRTETVLDDKNHTDISGTADDTSAHTLCLAIGNYSVDAPPTTDAEFVHYPTAFLHAQHVPPSPPDQPQPPSVCCSTGVLPASLGPY